MLFIFLIYIYIYIYQILCQSDIIYYLIQTWLQPMTSTSLNIFLLNVKFSKFSIGLHFLLIFSILAKFLKDQRSIIMSLIKCLNSKFLQFKIMHKKGKIFKFLFLNKIFHEKKCEVFKKIKIKFCLFAFFFFFKCEFLVRYIYIYIYLYVYM